MRFRGEWPGERNTNALRFAPLSSSKPSSAGKKKKEKTGEMLEHEIEEKKKITKNKRRKPCGTSTACRSSTTTATQRAELLRIQPPKPRHSTSVYTPVGRQTCTVPQRSPDQHTRNGCCLHAMTHQLSRLPYTRKRRPTARLQTHAAQ